MEIKSTTVHRCPRCGGRDLKKNGHADNGAQRVRCKSEACGKTFVLPRHSPEDKERVLRAYRERMSTRAIYRTFGVSYLTLMRWAGEKIRSQPALVDTLPPAEKGDVLEMDELWSFTGLKDNTLWLWAAMCRRTLQ